MVKEIHCWCKYYAEQRRENYQKIKEEQQQYNVLYACMYVYIVHQFILMKILNHTVLKLPTY